MVRRFRGNAMSSLSNFSNEEHVLKQWNDQRVELMRRHEEAKRNGRPAAVLASLTRDIHFIEEKMARLSARGVLEP